MSRQRIRSSVLESSTEKCPVCGGSGHVRSVSSVALQLLRAIEETLNKGATHNLIVRTRTEVALYVLNHKRAHLRMLEERFRIIITISADATVTAQQSYVIDRGEQVHSPEAARALAAQIPPELLSPPQDDAEPEVVEEAEEEAAEDDEAEEASAMAENEGELRRRRRRRGRGRGRDHHERQERPEPTEFTHETAAEHAIAHEDHDAGSPDEDQPRAAAPIGEHAHADREGRRRRRRGRRGGRRNRHRNGETPLSESAGPDSDLQHAVEDMDAPGFGGERPAQQPHEEHPVPTAEAEYPAPQAAQPAPVAAPPAPAPAAEPPAEPPRRRSTIREPAPVAGTDAPSPVPAPAISPSEPMVSSTASEPAAPKRGWWGKRLLGGN